MHWKLLSYSGVSRKLIIFQAIRKGFFIFHSGHCLHPVHYLENLQVFMIDLVLQKYLSNKIQEY